MRSKLPLHIAPAQAGESQVQHNRTWPPRLYAAERGKAVINCDHAISCPAECGTVEFAQATIVFDDQYVLLSLRGSHAPKV
jgi:hypothetical protein